MLRKDADCKGETEIRQIGRAIMCGAPLALVGPSLPPTSVDYEERTLMAPPLPCPYAKSPQRFRYTAHSFSRGASGIGIITLRWQ